MTKRDANVKTKFPLDPLGAFVMYDDKRINILIAHSLIH